MVARGIKWPRGQTPEVTPPGDHYQVSKNFLFSDPRVALDGWRLDVHGLVSRPLALSLGDLRAMPVVEEYATLACVGNNVPARAISTALWTGVRLADVLVEAGVGTGSAGDVVFTAADNYTDSVPLSRALHPGTLLAYEMNGQPLPREHGAPLRAIVPGIYGMKNVKWIESIELVAGDYRGYWQQRGWSDSALYQTLARIDEPRQGDTLSAGAAHEICGIAFAGERGIVKVEVWLGADDRATTTLRRPLSPYSWVLWNYNWQPRRSGRYVINARAYDATGTPQIVEPRPNFPDGATGLHTVEIAVH